VVVCRRVAVRVVGEHVARVVEDDVEDHSDPVLMGGCHHRLQVVQRPEVVVDLKEVLDAVAVIAVGPGDLLEHRADPDCACPQAVEIADLAAQAHEVSANPAATGAPPCRRLAVGGYRIARIRGREQRRRARDDGPIVAAITVLAAIGEAVEHQEVKDLVFPSCRRGKELAIE
jgi:hypothetical protein